VPEDPAPASVGLFRGSEHVDELVHEGRHRPAATPPRALVAGVCRPARARHLGYVLRPRARAVGDTRAVDRRRRTRLPGRPSARRATRARTLTSRSPFERPNAGGTRARPRARHPHPKDSILSLSRARSAHLTVGGCPRPYLAHRPRGVLVSPGAPPGVPVSSRAKSLSVQPTPLATVASTTHWRRRRASPSLSFLRREIFNRFFGMDLR
jgi:hypothetical protein